MKMPWPLVSRRPGRCAVCVAAMVIVAAPVWAQVERQPRAYRGLFGPAVRQSSDRSQAVDLYTQLDFGHDENIRPGRGAPETDPRYRLSGNYLGSSLRVSYDRRSPRFDVATYGSGQFRRYQTASPFNTHDLRTGAGIRADLSRYTSLTVDQVATWAPYFQLDLLPGLFAPALAEGPEVGIDFAIAATETLRLNSRVALSQRIGRRATFQVSGAYTSVQYDDLQRTDTTTTSGGAMYRQDLTRYAALRLGYRHVVSEYEGGPRLEREDLQVGLDYRRALSFSRRTTFGFSSGSTYLRNTMGTGRFRLLGNASLQHDIGRSWSAVLNYARNIAFIEGYGEPVSYDSLRGQLSGYLDRRSLFSSSLGYSNGAQARVSTRRYRVLIGDLMYQFAMTSTIAAYAQYVQYHYDYNEGFLPGSMLGSRLNRQSVRAGLSFWLPILR